MDNFLGRIRSGAGKAAFEADKLRRVNAVQSKIKSLHKEVEKAYYQIGQVAYALYGDGRITQSAMKETCDRLAGLQTQIATHEQEIAAIRAEEFVEPQTSIGAQYGRICPNGHGAISSQDNFCQTCGAKAVYVPPPTPAGMNVCPNCSTPLAADARFCASCGQSMPEPAPVPEPANAPANACTACGAALLPGAVFCAECGHRVPPDEAAAPEATESQTDAPDGETVVSEEPAVDNDAEETSAVEETDELETDWLDESAPETAVGEPPAAENEETSAIAPTEAEVSACPICDAPLLSDAVFCAECGHQIESEES